MPDFRLISAIALLIIGICFLIFSIRIWMTHPVNRVFTIGPFVTEAGLQLVLRHIPLVFALGFYALATALADAVHYARSHWGFGWDAANTLSSLSSVMAVFAAVYTLAISRELYHSKNKSGGKS